jgi:hypothetical protein
VIFFHAQFFILIFQFWRQSQNIKQLDDFHYVYYALTCIAHKKGFNIWSYTTDLNR